MPPPRISHAPANEVHTSFEPFKALLFDEIETELAEAKTCSIVAEPATDDRIHAGIGVARPIAVAMLGTQVRHSQQDKAPQIHVNLVSRRREFRENFHRRPPAWIGHQRQVEKRFAGTTAKVPQEALVLCADLLFRGAR